jgi:hypothetical protein
VSITLIRLHLTNQHTEPGVWQSQDADANQTLIHTYIIPEVALAGAADPPTKADGMKAAAEPAIARRITRRYIVARRHRKFYSLITGCTNWPKCIVAKEHTTFLVARSFYNTGLNKLKFRWYTILYYQDGNTI